MKLNERQACQILGLAAPTTAEAARKAYRKLARELHPDRGGDEERFKQVSAAYQYLISYYEDQPESSRASAQSGTYRGNRSKPSTHSHTKTQSRTKSESGTSQSSKTSGAQTNTKRQTQDKKQQQGQQHNHSQSTEDHREAWRAWRAQVDRNAPRDQRESKSPQGDRYERSHQSSSSSTHHTSTQSADPSSNQSAHHSSTQGHEVVEASVVPGLGDTLKRWGENVGDRVTSATSELGDRFNKWYRKSARSLFERGQDDKLKLNIDLTTALYGKQTRIAIQRLVACPECQTEGGQPKIDSNIPAAQWAEGCQSCGETGRIMRREELSVYVPPGGDKGDKLKINDKGSEGLNGSPSGHLYLLISPAQLPQGFRRNGADVELTQLVSADLLSRGGVLPLKTLRGTLSVRVPKNFQSGKKLMVPDQGFPLWSDPHQIGKLTICLRAITS